ncbi:hypothetical protein HOO65_011271 [Ceratocystis lukuohia]|uniref:C2H2-type domain-containing protein n=2 Tax=Ceratocystis TaxID=5157 RepID=A0A2C5X4N3_9PEZI|nr:hypothetical protein CFIMG_002532RA [Ceratocystis fimbriata CBS 114723]
MFAQSQPPDRGQPSVRNPFLPFGMANHTFVSLVSSVLSEIQPVSASWPEQDCLFADVGEYLVKCAEVLAEMADKLSNNQHLAYQMHQAQQQQQQQQWNRDCFNYQFYLAHKNESIKTMASSLRNTAEALRLEWSKSDHPPHPHHNHAAPRGAVGIPQGYAQDHTQQHPAHQQHPQQQQHPQAQQHQQQQHRLPTMAQSATPVSSVVAGPSTPQQHQQQHQQQQPPVSSGIGPTASAAPGPIAGMVRREPPTTRTAFPSAAYAPQNGGTPVAYTQESVYPLGSSATSGSMEPMEDELSAMDEERVRQLLNQPQHRGVGQHYCPLAERCDKGGVSSDGSIRLFERNSDYRTHLKKHIKMYKCPVPGCKNVEGFGRKDQLERHIRTTKHSSTAPGVQTPGNGPPHMAPAQPQPEFVPPMAHRY